MTAYKFEKNIREKLQEREIQPSFDAWDKLSSKMDNAPKRKSNRKMWFTIAASFVAVLLISSLVFNKIETEVKNNPGIVEKTTKRPKETGNEKQPILIVSNKKETKNELPKKQDNLKEKIAFSGNNKIETEVKNNPKIEEIVFVEKTSSIQNIEDTALSKKRNIDIEVDSLFRAAQNKIKYKKTLARKKYRVDAESLLNAVETELEETFRDKVFEAINKGYKKVRTAVAEREY